MSLLSSTSKAIISRLSAGSSGTTQEYATQKQAGWLYLITSQALFRLKDLVSDLDFVDFDTRWTLEHVLDSTVEHNCKGKEKHKFQIRYMQYHIMVNVISNKAHIVH